MRASVHWSLTIFGMFFLQSETQLISWVALVVVLTNGYLFVREVA